MRKGNKQNAGLNKTWGCHIKPWGKRWTATIRRCLNKKIIKFNLDSM
jgi:hypothetical protein